MNIDPTRIKAMNDVPPTGGKHVLYWMQQSQRAEFNPALEYAIERSNELGLPVLVGFGLMDDYPEAALRHYHFMVQGLADAQQHLRKRGILMVVQRGHPADIALELGRDAALIVCDRGYLRHQKQWRRRVADSARCPVVQVEGDSAVPVEVASDHAESAARTLRPKIRRHLPTYLHPLHPVRTRRPSLDLGVAGLDLSDADAVCRGLALDRSLGPVRRFRGGTTEAKKVLRGFVRRRLDGYAEQRSQPASGFVSHMSKYLHFGQISPVFIALEVQHTAGMPAADRDTFLEELLVRRELAHNFVHFTDNYDDYRCIPGWARASLDQHRRDAREHRYGRAELEGAQTHDPYWNAAMQEMLTTGYMHNHMRMYWGKKILDWAASPQEAYAITLALNNRYFLDGRDPASYANVAWVFGMHDRPWPERPVFGKVRSMTAGGLERKTDIAAYVRQVEELRADQA